MEHLVNRAVRLLEQYLGQKFWLIDQICFSVRLLDQFLAGPIAALLTRPDFTMARVKYTYPLRRCVIIFAYRSWRGNEK